MKPLPTHAVVRLPALDVRRRPGHESELRSQLLMGEVVRVLGRSRRDEWWDVLNLTDGYRGWVRTWGIVPATARRAARWANRARSRVHVSYTEARSGKGSGPLVTPLFWNGKVIAGRARGRFRPIELPDARRGWVLAADLTGERRRLSALDRIRSLLGSPYLWGGRTPMGIDCSAFVQQIWSEQGLALPRDTRDQYRHTRALRRDERVREGDLFFFGDAPSRPGHVGYALGTGYFAHCRGHVRINSIESSNPLWERALAAQFLGVRRPLESVRGTH